MENVAEAVKDIVEIVEQFYLLRVEDLTRKLENIRRINVDSLVDLIQNEVNESKIKTKRDIVKYVESIILD
ncbi:MAG: hypothetical protein A2287_00425 [Candidatus Melainabacteria bacterium RIFOXYA12_FULL_32_12]|nr:MAG: hypothetical protein A2255_03330 [Candidatus Melainabacteria bacterium RIFOXYA2_FULL_32_9]OGI31361.1 MAG: hypothetical protein A2287_00425 [Candidatus Melainabacteria bacterium RIFOXYA12_FULL_32_12]